MLQFPQFKNIPGLTHAIFTKEAGDYKGKNNFKLLTKKLNITSHNLIITHQISGSQILTITTTTRSNSKKNPKIADGIISSLKPSAIIIKTADCFPVFLFDPLNKVIALIHVGWKGAVSGIHLKAILSLSANFKTNYKNLLVGIGPGICKSCYQMSKKPIQTNFPDWKQFITKNKDQWAVDLLGYIKTSLLEAGIKNKNINTISICTNEDLRFFSHFRSQKTNERDGRFVSIIALT